MRFTRQLAGCSKIACLLLASAAVGCESAPQQPGRNANLYMDSSIPDCNAELTIASDSRALVVNEPEALASLPLEDVLSQLLLEMGDETTPGEMLRRLFDTNNPEGSAVYIDGIKCDSYDNLAHGNAPAAQCPRSEGALAASTGLFTPGNPDELFPVAVVNRFDLMPVSAATCGEARIVYAKRSGLTDPDNRLFLIFEVSVPNPKPGNLLGCRPVAEFWKSLENEPNTAALGERLRAFFLDGLPGSSPAILANNLGLNGFGGAGYYGGGGQVRVSQHMDEHWELRQMVLSSMDGYHLRFEPTTVGNNPMPVLFGPDPGSEDLSYYNGVFVEELVASNLTTLSATKLEYIGMTVGSQHLSGESAMGGSTVNNYVERAAGNVEMNERISARLAEDGLGADCPKDDPLTADSIVRRATMQSCAGCHAPKQFLGEERKVGCGLTWPDSLGEVHIDERGSLSPALKEVFLPHRAEVLQTYLQACDEETILANLGGPFGSGAASRSRNIRRTIGGSSTH